MKYQVEQWAFGNGGEVREVTVPDAEAGSASEPELLDLIYYYGHIQPIPERYSASVGDVIRLNNRRYKVMPVGFTDVTDNDADNALTNFLKEAKVLRDKGANR